MTRSSDFSYGMADTHRLAPVVRHFGNWNDIRCRGPLLPLRAAPPRLGGWHRLVEDLSGVAVAR
jgi:hypothetical protein